MMQQIFHDGKKSCVSDQKLRDWTKWFESLKQSTIFCEERYSAFATWFNFSVNKKQKQLQS
jgi:hypothetical protein